LVQDFGFKTIGFKFFKPNLNWVQSRIKSINFFEAFQIWKFGIWFKHSKFKLRSLNEEILKIKQSEFLKIQNEI
jgi:hypothetical protein